MNCSQLIQSQNVYDFIADDEDSLPMEADCAVELGTGYRTEYYYADRMPELSVKNYSYTAIPKCFGLLDTAALDASGILQLQNYPTLSLKGQGVLVGFVDTGIDYTNALFRNLDGSTRIEVIWDQTQESDGQNGVAYGVEFSREQINAALESENPFELVPSRDENGHGSFLASVACGNAQPENAFTGAAVYSEIAVVKLKQAKQYLRDYFFIPDGVWACQENDIMAGVRYLHDLAQKKRMPFVLCIGLGCNNGSHAGSGPLADLLNYIATFRREAVVIAAGNEAVAAHHYMGRALNALTPQRVEIDVSEAVEGFYLEAWSISPEVVSVQVQSPTGEVFPSVLGGGISGNEYLFVFENTKVTIDYRAPGKTRGDIMIFIRFENVPKGIWTLLFYPVNVVTGEFHVWLPMTEFLQKRVVFLRPNPDYTITNPASAQLPMTTGGYNDETGALYLESGRGYTLSEVIKPEFCAPSVDVLGATSRGLLQEYTKTSAAAAITTGACAQVLEWAVVMGNRPDMNTVMLKNMLIRGCVREDGVEYPNREWGYGKLNVYQAFEKLRI